MSLYTGETVNRQLVKRWVEDLLYRKRGGGDVTTVMHEVCEGIVRGIACYRSEDPERLCKFSVEHVETEIAKKIENDKRVEEAKKSVEPGVSRFSDGKVVRRGDKHPK